MYICKCVYVYVCMHVCGACVCSLCVCMVNVWCVHEWVWVCVCGCVGVHELTGWGKGTGWEEGLTVTHPVLYCIPHQGRIWHCSRPPPTSWSQTHRRMRSRQMEEGLPLSQLYTHQAKNRKQTEIVTKKLLPWRALMVTCICVHQWIGIIVIPDLWV